MMRWIKDRCHWQNLNEDKDGKIKGSMLRYGRLWLHRAYDSGNPDKYRRSQVEFSWSLTGMRWLGAGMTLFDGECYRDISFKLGLWFASFYLSLENVLPERFGWPRHGWGHETSVTIMADGACDGPSVSINVHHAGGDCWDCGGWNGPHWYWWPLNTLLGKPVYSSKTLPEFTFLKEEEPKRYSIRLPEGVYPVDVVLTEDSWKRPRWPRATVVRRAKMECPRGIPIPGKGENSWDCGEDATFGLTCPAATVQEGLEHLSAHVRERRERYGGKGWLPENVRG